MVSFPLAALSLAGATLPLLIPGVLYLIGYGQIGSSYSRVPAIIVALLGFSLGLAGLVPLAAGGEFVCSKTIRHRDGQTETLRVSKSESQTLGSRADGIAEIESECQQTPAKWAGLLTGGIAVAGIWLIAYLSGYPAPRRSLAA